MRCRKYWNILAIKLERPLSNRCSLFKTQTDTVNIDNDRKKLHSNQHNSCDENLVFAINKANEKTFHWKCCTKVVSPLTDLLSKQTINYWAWNSHHGSSCSTFSCNHISLFVSIYPQNKNNRILIDRRYMKIVPSMI